MTESTMVDGGADVVIEVVNDTLVADDGTFAAARQAMIEGMDSDKSEGAGWDVEIKGDAAADVATVVRTDATHITITLVAKADFAITANETITVTVPAAMLVLSDDPVVASPTFIIYNEDEAITSPTVGIIYSSDGADVGYSTTGQDVSAP